jgi:type I restriction enzyme S subunit
MTTALNVFEIAPGWREVPFKGIAEKVSESGFPNLESLSVFLDAGVVPRSSREDNHNQLGESLDKYQRVLPNDLVFNKLRTWQGGFGISSYEGIVSPAYIIARPNLKLIEPRFLGYLLKSRPYLTELTRLSKWMPPTQFDISWESIRDLKLRIPPIEEQKKIADYLDEQINLVNRTIDAKIRVLELNEAA